MAKYILIGLLFNLSSFADSFIPLIPVYEKESRHLSFNLDSNQKVLFDKVTFLSKEIETKKEKRFPLSKQIYKTMDKSCEQITFYHRKAIKEGSYFYNTAVELSFIKYNSLCKEEKINNLVFLVCNKDNQQKKYMIFYDNDEVEPSESSGVFLEKKCFNKLKGLLKFQ